MILPMPEDAGNAATMQRFTRLIHRSADKSRRLNASHLVVCHGRRTTHSTSRRMMESILAQEEKHADDMAGVLKGRDNR